MYYTKAEGVEKNKKISIIKLSIFSCGRTGIMKSTIEKICPNCGEKLPSDSLFCIKCGTKIDANVQGNETPTKAPIFVEKNKKNSSGLCLGVGLVAIIAGLFVIVAIVVLFLIVVIAVMPSESYKTCKYDSCDEEREIDKYYCYYHNCTFYGCINSKVSGEEYCLEHICDESGCSNQVEDNSSYCTGHQVDKKLGNEFDFRVNSAGGVELDFRAKNNSGKEIKYIRFDVEFRNAVGDRIPNEITGNYRVSVEVVGPIKSGESADFKDIIGYNDNCARIDINEVTIIYMDGTSQTGHYGWYSEK